MSSKRILIVEDNESILLTLKSILSKIGETIGAKTAQEARDQIKHSQFDLAILDVDLPDSDGFHLCTEIRGDSKQANLPIVFVTGKSLSVEKVMGLKLGADDYITKPFDPDELLARVSAVLRRSQKNANVDVIQVGSIEMNLSNQTVTNTAVNQKIDLTAKEFQILEILMQKPNRVYSRAQLIQLVWGENTHITDRTVDTHVSKVRKKLGTLGGMIKSIHGSGYKILAS